MWSWQPAAGRAIAEARVRALVCLQESGVHLPVTGVFVVSDETYAGLPGWACVLLAVLLATGAYAHWRRVRKLAATTVALQPEMSQHVGAEAVLRQAAALHQQILGEIDDALLLTDEAGRVVYVSGGRDGGMELATRLPSVGESIESIVSPELFARVRGGESVRDVRVVVRRAAQERALRVDARPSAAAGRSFLFACRDVTERERAARQLEEQRRAAADAQRMATLGALVSNLAHELNNPNHTIMLNLPVLRGAWQDALAVLDQHQPSHGTFRLANIPYADMRDDVLRLIDEIHNGADRIRAIVGSLRSYTRGHWQQEVRAVDLGQVLAEAVATVRPTLDAATDAFVLDVAALQPVLGNRLLLVQVFVGLLIHAAQSLTARAQSVVLSAGSVADEIVVVVRDRGRGVPESEVALLTKFFPQVGGSLELAMAAWAVHQHGGSISIESALGVGTSVRVTLPAFVDGNGSGTQSA